MHPALLLLQSHIVYDVVACTGEVSEACSSLHTDTHILQIIPLIG